MNENDIENKIVRKNLNGIRLNPTGIDSVIASKSFTLLPSGKTLICEIVLKNGFSVEGASSVVSSENFDREIGEEISFSKARDKIWELEGYRLQEDIYMGRVSK